MFGERWNSHFSCKDLESSNFFKNQKKSLFRVPDVYTYSPHAYSQVGWSLAESNLPHLRQAILVVVLVLLVGNGSCHPESKPGQSQVSKKTHESWDGAKKNPWINHGINYLQPQLVSWSSEPSTVAVYIILYIICKQSKGKQMRCFYK